jgi:hypothetical protein
MYIYVYLYMLFITCSQRSSQSIDQSAHRASPTSMRVLQDCATVHATTPWYIIFIIFATVLSHFFRFSLAIFYFIAHYRDSVIFCYSDSVSLYILSVILRFYHALQ